MTEGFATFEELATAYGAVLAEPDQTGKADVVLAAWVSATVPVGRLDCMFVKGFDRLGDRRATDKRIVVACQSHQDAIALGDSIGDPRWRQGPN